MERSTWWVAAAAVGMVTAMLGGFSPASSVTFSTVTGTVSSSNGPVGDGSVYFYATCDDYQNEDEAAGGDHFSNGSYTVTVPDGTYRVRISPDSGNGAVDSWHNAKQSCGNADVVTVAGNAAVDLTVEAATVTGSVSSSNGAVGNGRVYLYETCEDYQDYLEAGYGDISGGTFAAAVADGTYRVQILPGQNTGAKDSWHSAKQSCGNADVVTVNGNTVINLTALAGSNVTGTVSSDNGPVDSGEVYFYDTCEDYQNGNEAGYDYSISKGSYTVTIPDGTYRVRIEPYSGYGTTASWHNAKQSCAEADVVTVNGNTVANLRLIPGGLGVAGAVTSSNGPVDSGWVYFYKTCQDYANYNEADSGSFYGGGRYTVNVPDGTYRVRISPYAGSGAARSWHNAKDSCEHADVVTVNGYTTLNLTAAPGSNVSGTVSSSSGPVSDYYYVVFFKTCEDYEHFDEAAVGVTVNGRYEVSIPVGTYRVLVEPSELMEGSYSWHSAKQSCADADVVTVNGDTVVNLATLAGSNVTGTVSSSSGPVASGWVYVYRTCEDYKGGNAASRGEVRDGTYVATVPDGTYLVRFYPSGSGMADTWHNGKRSCAEADRITVSGDTTVNLSVLTGSEVTGTVSSSHGPVGDGSVYFYATCEDYENRDEAGDGPIDDAGTYSGTVPDGSYRVRIEPYSGYGAVASWHSGKGSCEDADVIVVSGNTTVNLVAVAGDVSPTPTPTTSPTVEPTSTPTPTTSPTVEPTPTPTPTVEPTAAPQTIKGGVPTKVKRGKRVRLPKSTTQGNVIRWKAAPKKVCAVKGVRVKGKKRGVCSLSAAAPASNGYTAYSQKFKVRVR